MSMVFQYASFEIEDWGNSEVVCWLPLKKNHELEEVISLEEIFETIILLKDFNCT